MIKSLKKEPNNAFHLGNFKGYLFENYISYILSQIAENNELIDWIIPIFDVKKEQLKKINETNRFGYQKTAGLTFYRDNLPFVEYDCVFSLNGKIIIVEMKSNLTQNVSYEKIRRRANFFEAATSKKPYVLLIAPEIIPPGLKEDIENNKDFEFYKVQRFLEFKQYYGTHWKEYKLFNTKDYPKIINNTMNFPDFMNNSINFGDQMKLVYSCFFNNSILKDEFWEKCEHAMKLMRKMPIGIFKEDLPTDNIDNNSHLIKSSLENKTKCIFYIKFKNRKIEPGIIICTKRKKKRGKKFKIGSFSYKNFKFVGIKLILSDYSYYYHEANEISRLSEFLTLDRQILNIIIRRCIDLSYFDENPDDLGPLPNWIDNIPEKTMNSVLLSWKNIFSVYIRYISSHKPKNIKSK